MSTFPLSRLILESRDVPPVPMLPGVQRQTLIAGEHLMMVLFRLEKGVKFPLHNHPHEQAGYILEGALDYKADGKSYVCRPGCSYFAHGNQAHEGEVVENCFLLDVFSPPRDDYRGGHGGPSYVPTAQGALAAQPAKLGPTGGCYVLESRDVPKVEMLPDFYRQTMVYGKQLMMVLFSMKQGADLPAHKHPHEQMGFVVRGAVEFTVDGHTYVTRAGCNYYVPSNVLHSAKVLEDALVVDAFSPPREDYLSAQTSGGYVTAPAGTKS